MSTRLRIALDATGVRIIGSGTLTFHRPSTVEEALGLLTRASGVALPYAGGTDLWPRWSRGVSAHPDTIVDLKHVKGLTGVSRSNGQVRIAACTTMTEVSTSHEVLLAAPVLAVAAGRIACPQVRNRATIGGNLCNASPAADTAIPLILLDAVVELVSLDQAGRVLRRQVPVVDFFTAPGSTVLIPGEVLTCVRFEPLPDDMFAVWDKFGTRPAMEIAVASVGVAVRVQDGVVTHARVGYGSVAPIPSRGRGAEAELVGQVFDGGTIERCETAARAEISPITDVRASEAYRRDMVGVMLRRMLARARRY